jgi:hypothetical protein
VYGNEAANVYVDGGSYLRIHDNHVYGVRGGLPDQRSGIGVSSEDSRYSSHHIWIYNNIVHDQPSNGLFLWQPTSSVGSANIKFLHNTLVRNSSNISISSGQNTAEVANNLGYGINSSQSIASGSGAISLHNNVWMSSAAGFVNAAGNNFALTASSPAINKGGAFGAMIDDIGHTFTVSRDYSQRARVVGAAPDAGAYEYQ